MEVSEYKYKEASRIKFQVEDEDKRGGTFARAYVADWMFSVILDVKVCTIPHEVEY